MYVGKKTNGTIVEINIADFKNPTKEELDGFSEIHVIRDSYKPVYKIVLEQIKRIKPEDQNKDEENVGKVHRKRKSPKES